jgi:type I restriction enzyme, S subunit
MAGDQWNETTLGAIAERGGYGLVDGPFGSNLPASAYIDDGVPVIRGSNLSLGTSRFNDSEFVFVSEEMAKRLSRSLCHAGDIVFTKKGTLGQTGLIPQHSRHRQFLLSSNQMKLSVDRKAVDPLFVYYYVSSPEAREKIIRDSEITGVPKTNTAYLRQFPIFLPPLDQQKAIAHILGTLDDKIELNRRMNETLEAMARAVFKSWFVDFDPVRAKAKGRDPGLPKHIADLFPDRFEDSELGQIPGGWDVVPLPEVIEVNPSRSLKQDQIALYLDMANMPTRGHSPDLIVERPFGSGMRFINGDTLVARITPCLENGKTAFVDFLEENQVGWGSTEYIVLRPKSPLPEEFAYCLARSTEFREFAIQSMTGTSGRQRVPPEALSHFRLIRAPIRIAEIFGGIVKPLFTRAHAAAKESRSLAAVRDTLLPKLISGELRARLLDNRLAEDHRGIQG